MLIKTHAPRVSSWVFLKFLLIIIFSENKYAKTNNHGYNSNASVKICTFSIRTKCFENYFSSGSAFHHYFKDIRTIHPKQIKKIMQLKKEKGTLCIHLAKSALSLNIIYPSFIHYQCALGWNHDFSSLYGAKSIRIDFSVTANYCICTLRN